MSGFVYVGVDGGGTHVRAVAVDQQGRELARSAGPAGLVDPRDPAAAAAVVSRVARAVLDRAGAAAATALCCGLAGAGRQQERDSVHAALMREHVAERVIVVGDAEAAMADAFPGGDGVLVVAGTGSIAWARAEGNPAVRVGGWGQIMGDEGSGYALGLAALRGVARAADRAEATALTGAVLQALDLRSLDDLVAWTAAAAKSQIAALAPHVLRCAEAGDGPAAAMRDRAVHDIVELISAAAARITAAAPRLALTGGLIAPGGPLRAAVVAAVIEQMPHAVILDTAVDAALGAAAIARAAQPPSS